MSAANEAVRRRTPAQVAPRENSVQSLARAFELLEHMADAGGEVGLTELSTSCGMPLPTIHRLMQTLVRLGYVRQKPSRRYAMGPRLIRLGETASRLLGQWAQPHLTELVNLTGESANLAMLDGDEVVYLAHVPSRHSMRMFTEVGRHVLPHCTGVGKAILSQLSEKRVVDLVGRTGLPRYTEHTITDLGRLQSELAKIREQGFAADHGEQEIGVRCVAVALPDAPTSCAISVSGPELRMDTVITTALISHMQRIAQELATTLSAEDGSVTPSA